MWRRRAKEDLTLQLGPPQFKPRTVADAQKALELGVIDISEYVEHSLSMAQAFRGRAASPPHGLLGCYPPILLTPEAVTNQISGVRQASEELPGRPCRKL